MSMVTQVIDSIAGSRWRRFWALVALGVMIGQTA